MSRNKKNLIIVILIFLLISLLVSLTLLLTSTSPSEVNVAGGSCSKKSNAPETTCYYVTCNESTEGACLTGGGTCCQWTPSATTSTCHTCSNGTCSQHSVDGYCPNFGYLAGGCGSNSCAVVNPPPPPPPPPTGTVGECGGCSQGGEITCSSGTCCSCGKCGGISKTCNQICNQNACGGGTNPPPPPPPAPNPTPTPTPTPNPTPTPTPTPTPSPTPVPTPSPTPTPTSPTTTGGTTQTTGSSTSTQPLPSTGVEDGFSTIVFGVIVVLIGLSLFRIRKNQ